MVYQTNYRVRFKTGKLLHYCILWYIKLGSFKKQLKTLPNYDKGPGGLQEVGEVQVRGLRVVLEISWVPQSRLHARCAIRYYDSTLLYYTIAYILY